jgi:hypothetical protein
VLSKLVIISSAKNNLETPRPNRFARFFVRNRLVPTGLSGIRNRFVFDMFGAVTPEEKDLLMAILRDSDGPLTRWSLKAIMDWQRTDLPDNCIHIHGTADKIIFPGGVAPTHWIEGGTHFMIYNRAAEVSALIMKHLAS